VSQAPRRDLSVPLPVAVRRDDGSLRPEYLVNVSESGLCLHMQAAVAVGEALSIAFRLPSDEALVEDELGEAADAVPAHLGRAAVGVDDAHAAVRAFGGQQQDEAVGADAAMAIAEARGERRGIAREPATRVDVDEVVRRALELRELERRHAEDGLIARVRGWGKLSASARRARAAGPSAALAAPAPEGNLLAIAIYPYSGRNIVVPTAPSARVDLAAASGVRIVRGPYLGPLAEAGGKPRHICRMTAYCCDKPGYLAARRELGAIWRRHMGTHYPAMSMIFVSDLLDSPGKIELEATAVIPEGKR